MSLAAADREIVKRHRLRGFVKVAWSEYDPANLIWNWHLDAMCEHLQALLDGTIRNLVINVPPGTGKTGIASIAFPVWTWIEDPSLAFIFASYEQGLSRLISGKAMDLILSKWFIQRWGRILADQNPSATEYDTTKGGFRFSTSVNGPATGRHADFLAVDDPTKPKDAVGSGAKKALQTTREWWGHTFTSRQRNPKTTRHLITMQRLAAGDLAGMLIGTGDYEVLRLPMRCVAAKRCTTSLGVVDKRADGELLHPDRYPEREVRKLEFQLGSPANVSAQLQQEPAPLGGNIFREKSFRYWHHEGSLKLDPHGRPCAPPPPESGLDILSLDCAFKGLPSSDRVACQAWRWVSWSAIYLLDARAETASFVETQRMTLAMARLYEKAYTKIVEDAANGPALINQLAGEVPGFVAVKATNKELRAHATSPIVASGAVIIPHPDLAPWVTEWVAELTSFPMGVYDDQVDATTYALAYFYDKLHSSLLEALEKA